MSSFILSGSSLKKNVLAPFIKLGVQNLMSFGGVEKCKWFLLSWNWKRRFCTGLINYYHLSEGFFKTLTFILTVMAIIPCCVQRSLRISRTRWTRTMNKPSLSALVWKRNTTSAPSWISTTRKTRPCVTLWPLWRRNPKMATRSWKQFNATWNSALMIAYTSKYLGDGSSSVFSRLSKCCGCTSRASFIFERKQFWWCHEAISFFYH